MISLVNIKLTNTPVRNINAGYFCYSLFSTMRQEDVNRFIRTYFPFDQSAVRIENPTLHRLPDAQRLAMLSKDLLPNLTSLSIGSASCLRK